MLSIVVPCYNEQESLPACHARLTAVLLAMEVAIEACSTQAPFTWEIIYVSVITLARNFGHQPAVTAGLAAARGATVAILDADLQDPPEVLPQMLALCRDGYDVVYGVRTLRRGESRFKLWTARLFYRALSRFADLRIPLDAGDFRMIDRRVVDALLAMPERHRLLRAMCSWVGFRQTGLPYHREARYAGATKYPFWKMVNLAFDGIFSFSTVPLRMLTYLGLLAACLSFVGVIWALFVRLFTHHWVQGWATLFIGMLFLSGLQMISLGIMGEYLGRIYTEVKQRPLYVVASVLGNETRSTRL